ncbi:ABC transporter permease [Limnoglobus roseus]|uniref:ABC transporter permease n=1 Tax=Limnoglobus roseus TaxID=2598579 RepID=A0A5C1ACD9_9BACT|nr:ABC transporter permease [Limnoglobus roseus]QEL16961.1 ABC transporter permease [Limnoglobus roseus]
MLTLRSLPWRSLSFHWRGNLAVLLAAVLSSAVLTGALFVGDSLRGSLRTKAERQLNGVTAAWTGNRLIRTTTAEGSDAVPALVLQGSLVNENAADFATVPRVVVIGLTSAGFERFGLKLPEAGLRAVVGSRVADKCEAKAGDKLRLSVQQFSNIPRSSIMSKRTTDATAITATLTVTEILPPDYPANDFGLLPNPAPPLNVFVPLEALQKKILPDNPGRVNALFAFGPAAADVNAALETSLDLPDWGLRLRTRRDPPTGNRVTDRQLPYLALESDRLLLEPAVLDAADAATKELGLRSARTTAYLAIDIAHGKKAVPYSIVAAVDPTAAAPLGPFQPPGPPLTDDEIVLADWPESPIRDAKPGDTITLKFFAPDVESGEKTVTADFKLRGKIPLAGVAADPTLTPPFPGITDKLDIATWQPPFTFDRTRIRPNDVHDKFWKDYRTTPKAYVNRATGEKLFSSRFGSVTSLRIAPATGETPEQTAAKLRPLLRAKLTPAAGGIVVENVRDRLLTASHGGTDFGGLFLGFSFFLIVSALLLVGLMFRLNVERRAKEVGSFLAAGYRPRTVLRLLLGEGLMLSAVGAALGVGVAVVYARFLLHVLTDLWPDPTVGTFLQPHTTPVSAALGFVLTVLMTGLTIWLAVRKLVRIAPPTLLRGQTDVAEPDPHARRRWTTVLLVVCLLAAVGSLVGGGFIANPDFRALSFFGGGSLLFAAGLILVRRWLTASHGLAKSVGDLSVRNAGRFPGRSVLTVFLIGSATFLLVAVESFRRKPDHDFGDKTGGSGGFNLLVESDVPLFNRLDQKAGRDDVLTGLDVYFQDRAAKNPTGPDKAALMADAEAKLNAITTSIPVRVVAGDDASCLNLYQAGRPRLLGVPDDLIERGGFRFAATEPFEGTNPWVLLKKPQPDGAVPVFAEQNTVMWMLKTDVGGTVNVQDEAGRPVKCRIVGTLIDSVFQSELVMADEHLRRLHPREEGFRLQLVETKPEAAGDVAKVLTAGLSDSGVAVTPSRERVAAFQAVVGTYLTTFQLLGALGLLLGLLGLAVVILRGVWERVGEFALLRAVGYPVGIIRRLVLQENLVLLSLGVALGLAAAVLSVLPHLALGGSLPWKGVGILLVGVFAVGMIVVTLATRGAARVPILSALRKE